MLSEFCGVKTHVTYLRDACFDMKWHGVDSRWHAYEILRLTGRGLD
jgi:hypothetical protein